MSCHIVQVMGTLSEEQYKSGSCFQAGSASNLNDTSSSSVSALHKGPLLFIIWSWWRM